MKTLIVEDNELNLVLARDLLLHHGHEVMTATTVAEARVTLSRWRPDVVLLDVQLPEEPGTALLDEIRLDPTLRSVPIIAVTAFAMAGDRERFLERGFDHYMSKPIDTRRFASEIEAQVSLRSEARGILSEFP